MTMDFDKKGRYRGKVARQWAAIRRKALPAQPKGLSGAALEAAVMGIALADPSLVKIEPRQAAGVS